jgi:hypothetical protein
VFRVSAAQTGPIDLWIALSDNTCAMGDEEVQALSHHVDVQSVLDDLRFGHRSEIQRIERCARNLNDR